MSSRKTPAKSPRQKPKADTAVSPMRITRLEEKTQLQELNQRLEQYIMRQRERDASQGSVQSEIDALKHLYEEETENLRADFSERVSAARSGADPRTLIAAAPRALAACAAGAAAQGPR
jgi:lamin B